MKKIFLLLTTTALMVGSSCKKEVTALSQERTATERVSSSEGAVTFSDVFTISLVGESLYNPCANELITVISGNLLIAVHGVYNGTKSTITVHANVQGATLVGESGKEYTASGSFNEQTSNFANDIFITKLIHFDRYITADSDKNLMDKDSYYIKVDANGNVTIIRDETHELYCQ